MQRIGRVKQSHVLLFASAIFLLATAYMFAMYGEAAYYAAFHRPFHLISFHGTPKYSPPAMPRFTTKATIARQTLSPGDTQTISVTETPSRSTLGYIEVWIQSPEVAQNCATSCHSKEVYKDDTSGKPTQFTTGKTETFVYTYKLPENLTPGNYKVSDIITSSDTFTDYAVNNNFAEFTVQ